MLVVKQQHISRSINIVILILNTIASDLKVTEEEITHYQLRLYTITLYVNSPTVTYFSQLHHQNI